MICLPNRFFDLAENERTTSINDLKLFITENSHHKLLSIISDACRDSATTEETHSYLQRGIELTEMSIDEIIQCAYYLHLPELAEEYKDYEKSLR